MKMFMSEYGKKVYGEVMTWDLLYRYYDDMTGCILIPETIYVNEPAIQKQVIEFLKHADVCGVDKFDNENHWALEYVKGYDDNAPQLGNDSWFVSIRLVESFC